ncbi:MAG: hypothetical protein L0241_04945 [Planctomycetia bacterium]|nr:hypothetical protein [Planctomycetia bacterium]
MGSLKLLSINPLWLLAVGVVGFGGWVAADAARPRPTATPAPEEERFAPDHFLLVAPDRPPLHPGMPRPLAEDVLSSATVEGAETAGTHQGVVVRRVNYRLEVQTTERMPGSLPPGCYRVTVEYDARHPVQALLSISTIPIPDHTPTHPDSAHPE